MSAINGFLSQVPLADLLLVVITAAMVASVLIGSVRYLRRDRAAAPAARGKTAEAAVTAAVAAYSARVADAEPAPDEALGAWEAELGERIDELETAFASLASKLTQLGSVDGDAADVLRGIASAAGGGARGRTSSLSEEQSQLLQRITRGDGSPGRAIGAGA